AVQKGLAPFQHLENAKQKAHITKWRMMENLDKLLPEFESKFLQKGGKVIWANDADEAREEIWKIMQQAGAKTVVKSKSMTTEEVGLNDFLEKKGVHTLETDLGEYIVQLLGQKPYHIVTPAMHLSLKDIAELLQQHFGTPLVASAEELTLKPRELRRQHYTAEDISIT